LGRFYVLRFYLFSRDPFNIGNVIKYLWRLGLKDNDINELKKAAWYLEDEIKERENNAKKR